MDIHLDGIRILSMKDSPSSGVILYANSANSTLSDSSELSFFLEAAVYASRNVGKVLRKTGFIAGRIPSSDALDKIMMLFSSERHR